MPDLQAGLWSREPRLKQVIGTDQREPQYLRTCDLAVLARTSKALYMETFKYIYTDMNLVLPGTMSLDTEWANSLAYALSTLCLGSKFGGKSRQPQPASDEALPASQRDSPDSKETYRTLKKSRQPLKETYRTLKKTLQTLKKLPTTSMPNVSENYRSAAPINGTADITIQRLG